MVIPKPLIDDIADGKCLPFVGAGLSLNARLPNGKSMPDWPALTKILASAAGLSGNKSGTEVASEYERKFGRVQLIEAIRHALHSDIIEPGDVHYAFVRLPFDTIYTTNFDLLLEDACVLVRKPYRSLVGELQIPFHGGPLSTNIVKMHGDLRHEEHLIVSNADYEHFLENYPVISTHLSAMLIIRTPLFIGYSLSDPDFNHIREVVRSRLGRFQRMSYIIQFNQSASKINKMLDENLHVLNFKVKKGASVDRILADFFEKIQEELDTRAGKKFRARKPEIFEEIPDEALEETSRAPDASALLSSSSSLCFILMPFGEPFDEIYRQIIHPVVLQEGLEPLRADDIYTPGSIMEQIRSAIQQARICIADLSGRNPNVLYELGIAQALGKPTVLLSQDITDVPFDVRHLRIIPYSTKPNTIQHAKNTLIKALQEVLGLDRLDEVRQLIDAGMIRAAVSTLGVLLEHSLRNLLFRLDLLYAHGRNHTKKFIPMGKMVYMLLQAKAITPHEARNLHKAIGIRNQAVHKLEEQKKGEAYTLFECVEGFIRKYIQSAEQGHSPDRK